jgi:hypothetical protein
MAKRIGRVRVTHPDESPAFLPDTTSLQQGDVLVGHFVLVPRAAPFSGPTSFIFTIMRLSPPHLANLRFSARKESYNVFISCLGGEPKSPLG